MDTPNRAYTVEEMQQRVLEHFRGVARYWATAPNAGTVAERCDGVVFSMLCAFDGVSALPAMDIVMQAHPSDKQDCIDNGENWVEPGMVINESVHLHDLYYEKERKGG